MSPSARPLLIVVSAPSGAGKTTLCDRLLAERPDIVYSVSCTTRAPRGNEVDGVDYSYLSSEEFDRRLARGDFLEHAVVHGHKYGTPRQMVLDAMAAGRSVLMDIDVQGAAQIRRRVGELADADSLKAAFVDIFIEPPSLEALRRRLESRGEDSADVIARRLHNAGEEMRRRGEFRFRIVNDDLEAAYRRLKAIVEEEQAR